MRGESGEQNQPGDTVNFQRVLPPAEPTGDEFAPGRLQVYPNDAVIERLRVSTQKLRENGTFKRLIDKYQ